MKKTTCNALTAEQQAELAVLVAMPDEVIDTKDIPELPDWHHAERGRFYGHYKTVDYPNISTTRRQSLSKEGR